MIGFKIPFNKASLEGDEIANVLKAFSDMHVAGDGGFTRQCHELLQAAIGAPKALLTTSCTHALEMAALLLDIQPGDEVIAPSFTFVSTVNAFVLRGARPVFVDIRPDTLNLDERQIEAKLTAKTRAIVPVHYAGVGCEMDLICRLASARGIAIVEDNAHGLFGSYKGRKLGSFGQFSTLSFHETKNITCGEGGALIINDSKFVERAEIIREKGTNRSQFFRGQVDKYGWVDVGSSYLPSEVLAAFLVAQLEVSESIQRRRHGAWSRYQTELQSWADGLGVGLPFVPAEADHPAHMFYLLMPTLAQRQAFIAHMWEARIVTPFHYVPLHTSLMGRKLGYVEGDCPITESVSDRLVRLPLYASISSEDQSKVIEQVLAFRG
ncbi:MAG: putative aminotransferase [Polyangiaceae bacterium]|jgi:dTDP-4-amino-4,6-dideoxygalactose transaminase|nr:putative aminotransferase [Polyangiaceae bacterium]